MRNHWKDSSRPEVGPLGQHPAGGADKEILPQYDGDEAGDGVPGDDTGGEEQEGERRWKMTEGADCSNRIVSSMLGRFALTLVPLAAQ